MLDSAPPSTGKTWYFPHPLVRRVARRLDRGSKGKRALHQNALNRLEQGTAGWADFGLFMSALVRTWWTLLLIFIVIMFAMVGVVAIIGGAGSNLWIIELILSIFPGVLSFGLIFFLHSIADAQAIQDPEDDSTFIRLFRIPRRINLLIIPAVSLLAFVVIWGNVRQP